MSRALHTYFGYATLFVILASGLIINLAQLIVFVLVRPVSKRLFRLINHKLSYSLWSQSIAVTDWISECKCRLYFKDEQTRENFGKVSGIAMVNHRYDIDWLVVWMLSNQFNILGEGKAMLKSSLKYVPVIGWGWALSDMIFLSRDWQRDREKLINYMDTLLSYPNSTIVAFFEGTRFTNSKYEASVKFAAEKNLPIKLKHHLIPRTRGFTCMLQQVRRRLDSDPRLSYSLTNVQIALEGDDNSRASMSSVLRGGKTTVHCYVGELDIKKVPIETEEATSNYLFEVYEEKDRLMEYFLKKGRFPGIEAPYKRKLIDLINWSFWMLVVHAAVLWLFYTIISSGNKLYIISLLTLALTAILSVKLLVSSTQVSKSSTYGTRTATTIGEK